MMSERQRQVEKTIQIGWFIQALGFAGFYGPFMYVWVWLLQSHEVSVVYSLVSGVSCLALLYGPWTQNRARLKRLEKYPTLFLPFFEAMITDMEANDAEKGDTWLTWDMDKLVKLQNKIIRRMQSKKRTFLDERILQPKLANYSAMLFLRRVIAREGTPE